jgi:hypothetical protein
VGADLYRPQHHKARQGDLRGRLSQILTPSRRYLDELLGRKVSDEYTVPLCRAHHRDLHGYGDEASWWAGVSIDPLPIALDLWRRSRLTASWSEPLSDAIALQRRMSSGRPGEITLAHPQQNTANQPRQKVS